MRLRFALCGVALALVAVPASAADGAIFQYDNMGRVVSVQLNDGTIIQYTYDNAGNITAKTVTCGQSNGQTAC
jgi:YD repeat-containing protein